MNVTDLIKKKLEKAVTRQQAEEAIKVLLAWAGDNPKREGLLDTPKRVAKAFEEYFSGYLIDSAMLKAMTIWLFKKIFQFIVTVNIIWHPSLALLM